jgi:hypothetical protein
VEVVANPTTGLTTVDLMVYDNVNYIPVYCSNDIQVTIRILSDYGDYQFYDYESAILQNGTSGTTITIDQQDANFRHFDGISSTNPQVPIGSLFNIKYLPTAINSPVPIADGSFVDFNKVLDPTVKQIDFLSSIFKKFNLIIYQDKTDPKTMIIEPYQYHVGTGQIYNWSDKLSYDKGFKVEPTWNYIDSSMIFKDSDDGDYGNTIYKQQNLLRNYGQNNVFNPTNFKTTTGTTETMFGPQVIRQWDTNDTAPNGGIQLPLAINYGGNSQQYTNPAGVTGTAYQYTGVKAKPKLIFSLGPQNIFIDTIGEVYDLTHVYRTWNIHIKRSNGTFPLIGSGVETVPVVSHTMPMGCADQYKINNDSACLLFQSEVPTFLDVPTYNTFTNQSAYNLFYADRIANLYSPNTRVVTGKFYLKPNEFYNLNPNDIIKIKDQYFLWDQINGYDLTQTDLTEVRLIQINNAPSTYPTRYFRYQYCDATGYTFQFKTDFTNPNIRDTNYGYSILYDHAVGTIYGQKAPTSGITTTFVYADNGTAYYVPYTLYEITADEYNSDVNLDWSYDTLHNHIWTYDYPFGSSMPTYWLNSGTTETGLNLFTNCNNFYITATNYNINVGSSIHYGKPLPPLPKFEGCILYWDGASYVSGGTWTDLSGNGNDGTFRGAAPTFNDTYKSVEFNGINNDCINTSVYPTSGYTIIYAGQYTTTNELYQARVCSSYDCNTNNAQVGHWYGRTDTAYFQRWYNHGTLTRDTNWSIQSFTYDGSLPANQPASYAHKVDNVYQAYETGDGNWQYPIQPEARYKGVSMGSAGDYQGSGFEYSKCGVGFVQIYNRKLTDAELTTIYNKAKDRYGL